MDRSNLENANPTILSVSQLPSRKRKGVTARRGPDSKCDSIVFPKRAWPYGTNSSSDEEDDDDDEIGEQPLDEQDIYGEHTPLLVWRCQRWHLLSSMASVCYIYFFNFFFFPSSTVRVGHTADAFADLISTISDPEHPHTLGQLSVVRLPDIHLSPSPAELPDPDSLVTVLVELTPTITHCSLATVIGLAVRCRLERTLPPNYRVDVRMKAGTHSQDDQVSKQLGDKERVAAALENDTLQRMVDKMLETCE